MACSKELGIPLRCPGTEAAYRALYQVSSADTLSDAAPFGLTHPDLNGEVLHVNGGGSLS